MQVRKQEGPLAGNRGGKRGFELQRQVLSKLFGNGGRSWPQKQPGRCAASWDLDDGFYVLKQDYVQVRRATGPAPQREEPPPGRCAPRVDFSPATGAAVGPLVAACGSALGWREPASCKIS